MYARTDACACTCACAQVCAAICLLGLAVTQLLIPKAQIRKASPSGAGDQWAVAEGARPLAGCTAQPEVLIPGMSQPMLESGDRERIGGGCDSLAGAEALLPHHHHHTTPMLHGASPPEDQ